MQALILFVFGLFLIALAGLEKILIYVGAESGKNANMTALLDFTPEYIWNITNYTFGVGLVLLAASIILFVKMKLNKKE